jgi:hypothetical protein
MRLGVDLQESGVQAAHEHDDACGRGLSSAGVRGAAQAPAQTNSLGALRKKAERTADEGQGQGAGGGGGALPDVILCLERLMSGALYLKEQRGSEQTGIRI